MFIRTFWFLRGLIFLLLLMALVSCDDKEDAVKYKGTIIISSEKKMQPGDIYVVYGYSFEKGKNVPYTLMGGSKPDIIAVSYTHLTLPTIYSV